MIVATAASYFITLSCTSGAAPPRPRMVSTFFLTASRVSGLTRAPWAPAFRPSTAVASSAFFTDDQNPDARKFAEQLRDQRRPALLQERDAEQNDVRLQPADTPFIGLLGSHELMGLDLVVQHELQGRAGDLIIVDHEYASLVDSL